MLARKLKELDQRILLILICNSLCDIVEAAILFLLCVLVYNENVIKVVVVSFSFYKNTLFTIADSLQLFLYYITLDVVLHFAVGFVITCWERLSSSYLTEPAVALQASGISIKISEESTAQSAKGPPDSAALPAIWQDRETAQSSIPRTHLKSLRATVILDKDKLEVPEGTTNTKPSSQEHIVGISSKSIYDVGSQERDLEEGDVGLLSFDLGWLPEPFAFRKKGGDGSLSNWLHALL